MARFDLYRLKADNGLVLDLQSDFLNNLDTRVVAPLLSTEEFSKPISRLNPRFDLDGKSYVLITHMIGTISAKEIAETVGNLSRHYDEILAATDFLFQGF